jgi:hypothetical protein
MSLSWLFALHSKTFSTDTAIKLEGDLPARDVAEICHIIRHDIWRDVLPYVPGSTLGWRSLSWSISRIPGEIRRMMRDPERINSISANADGTVAVRTYRPMHMKIGAQIRVWYYSGRHYVLKKGAKGWQIISKGSWMS